MKTLLKNEVSQVSGGNDCYAVVDCYYPVSGEGNILTLTKYSSSICPTLGVGATVNDPKVPKTLKFFCSNTTFGLDGQYVAVVRVGRYVC